MSIGTSVAAVDEDGAVRSRDAAGTRQLLLQAARIRFARDGYSATTVRDIANDARRIARSVRKADAPLR